MINIVILSHADLAAGFLSALKMVACTEEHICAVGLNEGESFADYYLKVESEIALMEPADGLVLLCDLVGGTPCNAASKYLLAHKELQQTTECIAGINLSMLMDAALSREFVNIVDLKNQLFDTAHQSVEDIGAKLKNKIQNIM